MCDFEQTKSTKELTHEIVDFIFRNVPGEWKVDTAIRLKNHLLDILIAGDEEELEKLIGV